MTMTGTLAGLALAATATLSAGLAAGQPLTADHAVELALRHSSQVINSEAGLLDARSGLYGAYSGVLPHVSASVSRSGFWQEGRTGLQAGSTFPTALSDFEQFSTSPRLSASWNALNLSSLAGLSSARSSIKAAQHQRTFTRQDVAFTTRRQFYEVVRAVKLAEVAEGALRLSRDDERRVNALFEVGSVSRSDLLKARVRTAQSQLDSLTAHQLTVNQRILLAEIVGVPEAQLGAVDTVLTTETRAVDREALLAEAARSRPDLAASEADVAAARAGLRSAQFARLPYVSLSGGLTYRPRSSFKQTILDTVFTGNSQSDLDYSAAISLNLDIFNGFQTESQIASSRSRLMRAQETRDALRRNLAAEVDQALLAYREAITRNEVASRALESATENLKLTQQKYNVGSSTILELIDAQVQLQRAQSDRVTALSAIQVAEAQLDRVRGLGR